MSGKLASSYRSYEEANPLILAGADRGCGKYTHRSGLRCLEKIMRSRTPAAQLAAVRLPDSTPIFGESC
jgi:hypothetical protein